MKTSDLGWFGLRIAPFSKEIGDDDLWLPASKVELVDELAAALEAHATVLLTGEPGVGKTCVLRALRRRLSPELFRMTYCHNATLGRRDFYRQLCVALGLQPSATAAGVFYTVSTHVEDLGLQRTHPVFLLDSC
jgi:type II secretory pathway predicted ATPase ExeA